MRLTVLQQQTKASREVRPETGAEVSKRLESVKHLLWQIRLINLWKGFPDHFPEGYELMEG